MIITKENHGSERKDMDCTLHFIVATLLVFGASYLSYFPGDVAMSNFIQQITPASTG